MKKQLLMLAFAMAAMTAPAQTVIFDGESGEVAIRQLTSIAFSYVLLMVEPSRM